MTGFACNLWILKLAFKFLLSTVFFDYHKDHHTEKLFNLRPLPTCHLLIPFIWLRVQYSCLENSRDRGAWQAIAHSITERLTNTWIKCPLSHAIFGFGKDINTIIYTVNLKQVSDFGVRSFRLKKYIFFLCRKKDFLKFKDYEVKMSSNTKKHFQLNPLLFSPFMLGLESRVRSSIFRSQPLKHLSPINRWIRNLFFLIELYVWDLFSGFEGD